MSNFIANNRIDKHMVENVLGISNEAKLAKKLDKEVINATVGSYHDENGCMHVFKCVDDAFKNVNYNEDLSYAKVPGPDEFNKSIINWVLGDDYINHYKEFNLSSIATPGGTGAIAMALSNYADSDSTVLIPNFCWPSYVQIAGNLNLKTDRYSLFDDNYSFNVDALCEKILEYKNQSHTVVIINDPCHNPTGFTMSNEMYVKLVEKLNLLELTNYVTILMDVAYLDFEPSMGKLTRLNFIELLSLNNHYNLLFAASLSKTLGIYGLRLGSLISVTNSKEANDDFLEKGKYFARSTWSNPNHFACSIVANNLSTIESRLSFRKEINEVALNLIKRGLIITQILDEYKVKYVPYVGGFFFYIPSNDDELVNKLKEEKVYALKMGEGVRIAVSSISLDEAYRLGHILGKILNN